MEYAPILDLTWEALPDLTDEMELLEACEADIDVETLVFAVVITGDELVEA